MHKISTLKNNKSMSFDDVYEKELSFQTDRRKATVEFINIISDLWYDKSIELVLFRNQIIDRNVSEILNLHEYAGEFVQKPISIFDSVENAQAIKTLDLPPAKLDIGKLTYEYHLEDNKFTDALAFVSEKLKDAKEKAEIISSELGYKIGGLKEITYGSSPLTPNPVYLQERVMTASSNDTFSNLEPSPLSFSDSVSIIFIIIVE